MEADQPPLGTLEQCTGGARTAIVLIHSNLEEGLRLEAATRLVG